MRRIRVGGRESKDWERRFRDSRESLFRTRDNACLFSQRTRQHAVPRLIWQPLFLPPRSFLGSSIIVAVTTSETGVAVKRPNRCYREVPGVGYAISCDTTRATRLRRSESRWVGDRSMWHAHSSRIPRYLIGGVFVGVNYVRCQWVSRWTENSCFRKTRILE